MITEVDFILHFGGAASIASNHTLFGDKLRIKRPLPVQRMCFCLKGIAYTQEKTQLFDFTL